MDFSNLKHSVSLTETHMGNSEIPAFEVHQRVQHDRKSLVKHKHRPLSIKFERFVVIATRSQLPNRSPQVVHVSQLRIILQDLTVTRVPL